MGLGSSRAIAGRAGVRAVVEASPRVVHEVGTSENVPSPLFRLCSTLSCFGPKSEVGVRSSKIGEQL